MAVPKLSIASLRPLKVPLLTAVVYFTLARVSLLLAVAASNATPVWPPSGWALVALLLLGRRVLPGIWVGAAAVNTVVFLAHGTGLGKALWVSSLIATGNTAEALAGFFMLRHLLLPGVAPDQYFQRVPYVLRFLLTAVFACFISCTIGTLAIDGAGLLPAGKLLIIWFTWWTGDVTGVLLFGPLLLTWSSGRRPPLVSQKKLVEGVLFFAALGFVSGAVFTNWFPSSLLVARSFWVVPFLMWAAVRFNRRVVVAALMLSALLALYGTVYGKGPFSNGTLNDNLLAVQAFVAVNTVMALLLHAALVEREQVTRSLRQAHNNLERLVAERTAALDRQKLQVEHLLLNMLPSEVARELQVKGKATPQHYDNVSVLFTDFKDFSALAEKLSAEEVVEQLGTCFKEFDRIIEKHRLEKIKTIGDSYMCAGGIPVADADHPFRIVAAAIEIRDFMKEHNKTRAASGLPPMEIRIGVHVGPVVAGVVGTRKYAYDIWGSTVNIASRMETNGAPGEVNISAATYEIVREKYECHYRGKIYAKNVGEVDMYFVLDKIATPVPNSSLTAPLGVLDTAEA